MPPTQAELLRQLIASERMHHFREMQGERPDWDWRGVEVGGLSGFALSTAVSLEKAGLIEVVAHSRFLLRAYLGGYAPVGHPAAQS